MKSGLFAKLMCSSLILYCLDPHPLFSMDTEMRQNLKRTLSEAGFNQSNNPPKRLCITWFIELLELPIQDLIEKASIDEECRNLLINKIYEGFVHPEALKVNLKQALNLGSLKIDIKTLSPIELHLICIYNPDNILQTEAGKALILDLKRKAEQDPFAQNILAFLYEKGIPDVLTADIKESINLWTQAANMGFARAQNALGVTYKIGSGITQNFNKAFELFTKAANQGLAKAQFNLGCMYVNDQGTPQDYAKALEWYTKAANQGLAAAQYSLAYMYRDGQGTPKNDVKVLEWFTKAANQGLATAQYFLGFMYRDGQGTPKDDVKALEWFTKAADQGYMHAQYSLACMYRDGQGTPKNDVKALEWFTKAANQGLAKAQFSLAYMYKNGQGTPQDNTKAIEWYTKAGNQGLAMAQFNLGVMYDNGQGTPQDNAKAVEWYTKAANQGHAAAQHNLGVMYEDGQGVDKDYAKTLEWFTKAANQEEVLSQQNLKRLLCRNNPKLPDNMNAFSAEMNTKISDFIFELKKGLGEVILLNLKNNEAGSFNTQGTTRGMAIPSLRPFFQRCQEYALKIMTILEHLQSQEAMAKGFLMTTLELNPSFTDKIILKQQLAKSTLYVHLISHPYIPSYLSFESTHNLEYSMHFQNILDDQSSEYLELKKIIKNLTDLYDLKIRRNWSEALILQDSQFNIMDDGEKARTEMSHLNESIKRDQEMYDFLVSLDSARNKLIKIIEESTPLRNLAFSGNPLMKHF